MSGGDKEQGDQFLDEVTASDQGKDQADESPDFIEGGLMRDYQVSGPSWRISESTVAKFGTTNHQRSPKTKKQKNKKTLADINSCDRLAVEG